jgi:hypothetical protein
VLNDLLPKTFQREAQK